MTINGNEFSVSLDPPGLKVATTSTIVVDLIGRSYTINSLPGNMLVVATLDFSNRTDHPEWLHLHCFDCGESAFPVLAIPASAAPAFSVDSATCIDAPLDYCNLGAVMARLNGATTNWGDLDGVPPFLVAPKSTATLTIVAGAPAWGGARCCLVPKSAPLKNISVLLEKFVQFSPIGFTEVS